MHSCRMSGLGLTLGVPLPFSGPQFPHLCSGLLVLTPRGLGADGAVSGPSRGARPPTPGLSRAGAHMPCGQGDRPCVSPCLGLPAGGTSEPAPSIGRI